MTADDAIRSGWLGAWGAMRHYHRYAIDGFERLCGPGAALIVGYHGRPIAHDLCMLSVSMHERLGYLPHGILHGAFADWPGLRTVKDALGFVTGDGEELAAVIERGEHVIVTPGGVREGCRSFRHRYRVEWGDRAGYLRLAIKYRLPIIPVAAAGTDDTYLGLNDGYAWGRRLRVPSRLPAWIGLGPLGPWPLSPPFPVKIRQRIGEPIDLFAGGDPDPGDRTRLLALHRRVVGAVQSLLDHRDSEESP